MSRAPWWLVTGVLGLVNADVRGLGEVRYQWDGPWLMDSSAYSTALGDTATDLDTALARTAAWLTRS